jgi:polyhydroxyalkanoate synthesis regulator phasin
MFRDGGRKKEARRDQRGISVEDYRRAEREIRELVEKGKVSKEDAERRLIEMRKAIRREKPEG